MLAYLTVRDFALVDDLELRFVDGLTVITGESGAGKSILLEALGMVLGQRASRSHIRPDASQSEVCAEFDLELAEPARQLLAEHDLLDQEEPTRCLVRRVAGADGRSRAWINGSGVNIGVLRELCAVMVAIHDQFAQQQLLHAGTQLAWFDDFVGCHAMLDTVKAQYQAWRSKERHFEAIQKRSEEAKARRELLQYQVDELNDLNLAQGEFDELTARFKRLNHAHEIMAILGQSIEALEQQHVTGLGRARTDLERIEDTSPQLVAALELLESAEVSVDECLRQLRAYADALSLDEGLSEVGARLDRVHELARKHRVASADLTAKAHELGQELASLIAFDEDLPSIREAATAARDTFYKNAKQLSKARLDAVKPFSTEVEATLANLGMAQAQFGVEFSESLGERGLESIDFTVSANSKYAPGPLKDIASGGELSRISLAILAVVASHSRLPCLVLDEADIGVGGTTADDIGRMLRRLATNTQVVCVTHAPQVAALGDSHLRVFKTPTQDIAAHEVVGSDRVEEIARMVAGQEINAESRKYATVLLDEALKPAYTKVPSP